MTVPSREEVARAIAEEYSGIIYGGIAKTRLFLDAIARTTVNGEPLHIVIGTTHEGCETCGGTPVHVGKFLQRDGSIRTEWHCPDGRPVYWTVKGMNDEDS